MSFIKNTIETIQSISNHNISSPCMMQIWKILCVTCNKRPRKPPQDLRHRSNSTYIMLNLDLEYKHIVNQYCAIHLADVGYSVSDYEWKAIEAIKDFLEVFYFLGCSTPLLMEF